MLNIRLKQKANAEHALQTILAENASKASFKYYKN
jgi:hypothetical protein